MAKAFSVQLTDWVHAKNKHTIGELMDIFDERSFAFLFLILMAFPALPIPTGGIVHALEIIVILIASQMLIGRRELWLPKKMKQRELPRPILLKLLPYLAKYIRGFEKISKPRFAQLIPQLWFRIQLAAVVIIFTLFAFFAPPFTGLDTIPSLGVVILSIGIILNDLLIIIAGYIVGIIGCSLVIFLGAGVLSAIQQVL